MSGFPHRKRQRTPCLWPDRGSSLACCVAVRRGVAPALFERPLALRGSGSGIFTFWECLPDARAASRSASLVDLKSVMCFAARVQPVASPLPCRQPCGRDRLKQPTPLHGDRASLPGSSEPNRSRTAYPSPTLRTPIGLSLRCGGGGQPRPVMRRRKSAKRAGSASDKSRSVTVKLP